MSSLALLRGQGSAFADLPPTLRPHAIAASAPPSDHLRTLTLSGLIYFSLVAAGVALSSLATPPALVHAPPPPAGPTVVYEPPAGHRVTLPPLVTTHGPAGGMVSPTLAPPAGPRETPPTEAPAGLPTENHALDPVTGGSGSPAPGPTASQGPAPAGGGPGPAVRDFTSVGLAVLRQVDPVYPDFARRAHIQGPVVLMMTVDEQGRPTQVQVLEGHPVFHEAARQAARQWRFEPARMDGRPVPATFRLTLKFSLR